MNGPVVAASKKCIPQGTLGYCPPGIPVFPGGSTPFGSPASVWGVCEEGESRLLGAGGGSGLGGPETRGN